MKSIVRSVFIGSISFIGLIFLNFLLISVISRSPSFAFEQLLKLRFYILPLALGFGVQAALFFKIRRLFRKSSLVVSGTGAASTGSMLACCAHHLTEALPLLAIGGVSSFFTNFQKEFLLMSILINWLGALHLYKKFRVLNAK